MIFNFDAFFAPGVRSGAILQTIRRKRKNQVKPGGFMHNYQGMRTRSAELLCRVKCISVQDIILVMPTNSVLETEIVVDSVALSPDEREQFARQDGFPDYSAWARHWAEKMRRENKDLRHDPFVGDLIRWKEQMGPHICEGLKTCRHCGGPV